MNLTELKRKTPTELVEMAASMDLEGGSRMREQDMLFALLKAQARKGATLASRSTSKSSSRGRLPCPIVNSVG